jgi:cbb3-type cytochrome oxidase cytochrome c subunit
MNHGPLIFLAAFFALAGSWFGFVLTPQMQVGQLRQTNTVPDEATYPLGRPGLARQGLEVYRANGCAYCHSQQLTQSGTTCNVLLVDAGTNPPTLVEALIKLNPGWSQTEASQLTNRLPRPVLLGVAIDAATTANNALMEAGAKSELWVVPVGSDIARGWGKRRSVAEDFLFDYPVMLGSQRIGPDLADIGARQPDANWHLRHLYAPQLEVQGSPMPRYRYLFEQRKIERAPSPEALVLPADQAPPPGYEIVPKPRAKALVAYLTSLRIDAPLFDAPLTVPSAPPAATTNTPAGSEKGSTNSAPAK